ncbi:MAG: hypothetical protein ABSH22_20560 [Tepidisphaeraceae bacterium]|jgi:hypothetical protein
MASQLLDNLYQAWRSIRRAFTGENLISNLKTLLGVAPLTVLVWVYAEQQQLVTEKDVPLRISLQSADPAHRSVTLVSPNDGTVQLTLQGSQVGIDRVKLLLQQTLMSQPLEIDVPTTIPPGSRQPMATMDQIAGNRLFYSQGVTVTECSPETIIASIDAVEDRDAPVQAEADVPGLIKAVFHPATVKIHGPVETLDELQRTGRLIAMADLANVPALKTPGDHKNVTVRLVAPDGVTLNPDTILADLTVGQADTSVTVAPVPVKIMASKWLMDNFKFDFKDVITDGVVLTGPPQQIDQIDPRAPKLVAVVELDNSDGILSGQVSQKPLTYEEKDLPEGVHVKPDASPRTIQISITPR